MASCVSTSLTFKQAATTLASLKLELGAKLTPQSNVTDDARLPNPAEPLEELSRPATKFVGDVDLPERT